MLHWAENGWMEFSVSTGSCRDGCGKVTQASLPEGVSSQRGPQLTALMAYLTVICRVPRRLMQRFLEVVMGISLSLGSTQKAWEEVWPQRGALLCWCACWGRGFAGMLWPSGGRTLPRVRTSPAAAEVLNVDETSWWTQWG